VGGWSWAMVWPGSLSDFCCTRYLLHGGRVGWENSSVRSDKLGSGLLGAPDGGPHGEERSTLSLFCYLDEADNSSSDEEKTCWYWFDSGTEFSRRTIRGLWERLLRRFKPSSYQRLSARHQPCGIS
jgi:hypothetical protein